MHYDAVCRECGQLEIEKSMHDPFPEKCPQCGESLVRRFASVRTIYNAPGFYGYDHQMRRHMKSDADYAKFLKKRKKALHSVGMPER